MIDILLADTEQEQKEGICIAISFYLSSNSWLKFEVIWKDLSKTLWTGELQLDLVFKSRHRPCCSEKVSCVRRCGISFHPIRISVCYWLHMWLALVMFIWWQLKG